MKKPTYKDFPIDDCIAALTPLVEQGCVFYQKWTCEGCGERVTGSNPNMMTALGHHEECGHVTDLAAKGCNYLLTAKTPSGYRAIMKHMAGSKKK